MNKLLYYPTVLLLLGFQANAQTQISFENTENYNLGNLHNQNGWEVTESGSSGIINNQIITNERASDGTNSFKNGFQSDFDYQWFPIFGASKVFQNALSYNQFKISFDVNVNLRGESDFEFTLFGIQNEDYVPVAGFGLDNRGYMYVINSIDYDMEYAEDADGWPINTWNNFKIEVTSEELKFYYNQNLVKTISNYTQTDILGFNMLHNNFGGDAYYDNFLITSEDLSVRDIKVSNLAIYPNPAKDILNINSITPEDINKITIYDLNGKLILQTSKVKNIDIKMLNKGTYLADVEFTNGLKSSRKFIKK